MVCSGTCDVHGVTRIIDLRIPIHDSSNERVGAERRCKRKRLLLGQVAVVWHRRVGGSRHRVVQHHARADVGPLPDAMLQWIEKELILFT